MSGTPHRSAFLPGSNTETKVDRYSWSLHDDPGELRWIDKSSLRVDQAKDGGYQRNADVEAKIIAIARAWSWVACGALIVAERSDKSLYIVDGQHRHLGALRRADIRSLPCVVFKVDHTKEEALGFLRANTQRRAMSSADRHAAQVVAEDTTALVVDELITQAGRRPANKAGESVVRCISVVRRCAEQDEGALRRIWPLVVKLCDGRVLHERVLATLHYLEVHAAKQGMSVLHRPFLQRLEAMGYSQIVACANKASAYYSRGGAKVWAHGVASELNKGLRSKRIVLPDLDAGRDEEVQR